MRFYSRQHHHYCGIDLHVKNDRIDSHKIAVLLRGGMLPQAYVYPAAMRSTRDLIRRRLHLVRKPGPANGAHPEHARAI